MIKRGQKYILVNKVPYPILDLYAWNLWNSKEENMRVALTEIADLKVSTVFLGRDHQWEEGEPLLFETTILHAGLPLDENCSRYSTYDEALAGHENIVAAIRNERGNFL